MDKKQFLEKKIKLEKAQYCKNIWSNNKKG